MFLGSLIVFGDEEILVRVGFEVFYLGFGFGVSWV